MGQSLVLTTTMPALHGGKIKIRTKNDMTHNIMIGNCIEYRNSINARDGVEKDCVSCLNNDLTDMYQTFGFLLLKGILENKIDIIAFDTENLKKKEKEEETFKRTSYDFSMQDMKAAYSLYLYGSKSGVVLGIAFSKLPECNKLDELIKDYKYDKNGLLCSNWFEFIKELMSTIKIKISSFMQRNKGFINEHFVLERSIDKLKDVYYISDLERIISPQEGQLIQDLVYEIKNIDGKNAVIIYPSREVFLSYCTSNRLNVNVEDFIKAKSKLVPWKKKICINKELKGRQVNSIERYYQTGEMV